MMMTGTYLTTEAKVVSSVANFQYSKINCHGSLVFPSILLNRGKMPLRSEHDIDFGRAKVHADVVSAAAFLAAQSHQ